MCYTSLHMKTTQYSYNRQCYFWKVSKVLNEALNFSSKVKSV